MGKGEEARRLMHSAQGQSRYKRGRGMVTEDKNRTSEGNQSFLSKYPIFQLCWHFIGFD